MMTEELGFHKRRSGVVRSSLTKLSTKLTELEADSGNPAILDSARNLVEKLKTLQQEFKNHQLAIIDDTEEGESLEEEQRALDDNDDIVSELHIRIQRLINSATLSKTPDAVSVAVKQLALIRASLESIEASAHDLDGSDEDDVCGIEIR